jgi:quercetin dioxygenase-like cupin family protein
MGVRRIVTGHDETGRSVIVEDAPLEATGLSENPGLTDTRFFQVWATHEMPVDLADDAMDRQRQGSRSTALGSGAGSVIRIGELGAHSRSPMHRTRSLDYGICLEGECELELDSGETITVHAGDIVVQRGTNHVWHNRSDELCRLVWILLDADPDIAAGRQ